MRYKEFSKRHRGSKLNELNEFKDKLELLYYDPEEIKPDTEDYKKDLEDRKSKIKTSSKLFDKLLNICTAQFNKFTEDQKKKINGLSRPENLTLGFTEDDLPPLEGDEKSEETIAEKVKLSLRKRKNEGTGLKFLTPDKLLTRLPILLAQIKAGNNSNKLKNESDKYCIFGISIIESPKKSL